MSINVISFLSTLKSSFVGSDCVYTSGSCYKLYEVLKEIFPEAKPLINKEGQHIISLIEGVCYDINGVVEDTSDFREMTEEQIHYFTNRVFNIYDPSFFVPEWVVDSTIPFLQTAQFACNLFTNDCEYGYKIVPIENAEEWNQIETALFSLNYEAYEPYSKPLKEEYEENKKSL